MNTPKTLVMGVYAKFGNYLDPHTREAVEHSESAELYYHKGITLDESYAMRDSAVNEFKRRGATVTIVDKTYEAFFACLHE